MLFLLFSYLLNMTSAKKSKYHLYVVNCERFINPSVNFYLMVLEDRLSFREALLEHRTEEEWKQYRPHHFTLYNELVHFEGKETTYEEVIKQYAQRFPADRNYSVKAHLNRMLADCEVPHFSFTNPEVIRGFLLSAKSPAEWARYQPSRITFQSMSFQYQGISILGQMLLYNIFVELDNQENGTFYAFLDYQQRPDLTKRLGKSMVTKSITKIFDLAGIKIKSKLIAEENITSERLREILLTKRTEEEWKRWEGNSSDFNQTWFDLVGYRNFNGASLLRHYEEAKGRRISAKDLFTEAKVEVGSDPTLLHKRIENRFERLYGILDDPVAVRDLFLQLKSEEEWKQPQQFTNLRRERVAISVDRSITIHTLLHLFSAYKYNAQQDSVESYICFEAMKQNHPKHNGLFKSNKTELSELLDFAGLEHKFIPTLGDDDIDLHDPALLKRMLFHAKYENRVLSVDELNSMPFNKLRKATFTDPSTGLELKGQSLMIFYSALYYVKEHPEMGLEEANKLNKGKSNQAVMNEILEKAGLKR